MSVSDNSRNYRATDVDDVDGIDRMREQLSLLKSEADENEEKISQLGPLNGMRFRWLCEWNNYEKEIPKVTQQRHNKVKRIKKQITGLNNRLDDIRTGRQLQDRNRDEISAIVHEIDILNAKIDELNRPITPLDILSETDPRRPYIQAGKGHKDYKDDYDALSTSLTILNRIKYDLIERIKILEKDIKIKQWLPAYIQYAKDNKLPPYNTDIESEYGFIMRCNRYLLMHYAYTSGEFIKCNIYCCREQNTSVRLDSAYCPHKTPILISLVQHAPIGLIGTDNGYDLRMFLHVEENVSY